MKQVLINLIGNAIKFTEAGSVELQVEFDTEARRVAFTVADTGIGMTREQAARVLEPFQQADTSTTRRFGGTGLGITISRRLAELMGGVVEIVETAPGVGTKIRFMFPVELDANSNRAFAGKTPIATGPQPTLALRGRILLAEDGADNQRLIRMLLTRAGAEVDVVENGAQAFEAVQAADARGRPYHLVLMDMQMPQMDGYTATRKLRAAGQSLPVVALTAHAMAGDREKCLSAGCDDYATKPVQRAPLLRMIAQKLAAPTSHGAIA